MILTDGGSKNSFTYKKALIEVQAGLIKDVKRIIEDLPLLHSDISSHQTQT
jgi:hypothetical protein